MAGREGVARRASARSRQQIDQARTEAEQAQRTGDLGRAAELTYGQIPQLERQMREAEAALKSSESSGPRFLKEEVDAEDIADVVARWTGIPRLAHDGERA